MLCEAEAALSPAVAASDRILEAARRWRGGGDATESAFARCVAKVRAGVVVERGAAIRQSCAFLAVAALAPAEWAVLLSDTERGETLKPGRPTPARAVELLCAVLQCVGEEVVRVEQERTHSIADFTVALHSSTTASAGAGTERVRWYAGAAWFTGVRLAHELIHPLTHQLWKPAHGQRIFDGK